ncbi:MAG: hypothetical protein CL878_13875 [Dehalococcoidia bacterium]|nr:hypothetical protein [Dehalococcoidia bacterium]
MREVLRIVAIATFFLGLGLLTGNVGGAMWRWLHVLFGLGTVVLAAVELGPFVGRAARAGTRALGGPARIAWWWSLIPLVLGIALYFGLWSSGQGRMAVVAAHVIAGIAAVGLIEMALGRARRAAREEPMEDAQE